MRFKLPLWCSSTLLIVGASLLAAPSAIAADRAAATKATGKATDKATDKAKAAPARPTVAVLYFDYTGKDDDLAVLRKGLAQMLISDLSAIDAIALVERDRLQEVLAELKLQQSKKFDPKTAGRIGKLLGARFMVLGGYFAIMGTLRIDARVVEVETGRVIKSVGANGKQDAFIDLEQSVSGGLAAILRGALPPRPAARPGAKASTRRVTLPKKLHTRTAVRYAKALDAKDRGDLKTARAELAEVVKERPDFRLAQLDLSAMIQ